MFLIDFYINYTIGTVVGQNSVYKHTYTSIDRSLYSLPSSILLFVWLIVLIADVVVLHSI